MPGYFGPELFGFLRKLKRNNNREWFMAHKAEFEECVRDPFLRFIADVGPHLRRINPLIVADPHPTRGSLFRIYRDTRFSADKTPYKTHASAHFSGVTAGVRRTPSAAQGNARAAVRLREQIHLPGYYLHFQPGSCFLAGGLWRPEQPVVTQVRQRIVDHPERWKQARRGLTLEGDALSRPPRGFAADHPLVEDLKRKDFIASIEFSEAQVCGDRLMNDFTAAARRLAPLLSFLTAAVSATRGFQPGATERAV
jgi:uncharacterized protein (TIGR02453 family)